MHYVYLLQSLRAPDQRYVGLTADLREHLRAHNRGDSPHTAKHKPWRVVVAVRFADREQAAAFEKYLKSGSGRAFAKRHFL